MKKFILLVIVSLFALSARAQVARADSLYISKGQQLILALNSGDFDKAATCFDATVSNQINPEVLKKIWGQLFGQVGNLISTGKPGIEKDSSVTTVYIPCAFEDATLDLKLSFTDQYKMTSFFFVGHTAPGDYHLPAYADTSLVMEQDIIIQSGKFRMPGKYLYPKNMKGRIPVVILVQGSGPNDMDETIDANKPFKDLAYALAKQGIGVVRYDKRTKVYAMQTYGGTNITLEQETIIDAISAARLARRLPNADSNRIFIIGHSLGAMAAPLIAEQAGNMVHGIVMMAGPARSLEDVILEQSRYLASLLPSDKSKKELQVLESEVQMVHKGGFSPKTPSNQLPLGLTANYWLFLHNYHQTETARKLKIPILVLQGQRDFQVSMKDYHLWQEALAKQTIATFHSYPKLNHLFIEGDGRSTPAEYDTPGHVAEYVTDDIAKWIKGI